MLCLGFVQAYLQMFLQLPLDLALLCDLAVLGSCVGIYLPWAGLARLSSTQPAQFLEATKASFYLLGLGLDLQVSMFRAVTLVELLLCS